MAKVKVKESVVDNGIPNGMKASDLSVEKRFALYQAALKKFDEEASKIFGVSVGVELKYTPRGIVPAMVLVDLLKANAEKETKQEPSK